MKNHTVTYSSNQEYDDSYFELNDYIVQEEQKLNTEINSAYQEYTKYISYTKTESFQKDNSPLDAKEQQIGVEELLKELNTNTTSKVATEAV